MKPSYTAGVISIVLMLTGALAAAAEQVAIVVDAKAAPRVKLGVEKLSSALRIAGCGAAISSSTDTKPAVVVGTVGKSAPIKALIDAGALALEEELPDREGFIIKGLVGDVIAVAGSDDSGTLYGCLELADRVRRSKSLPRNLDLSDAPAFALRGPSIGMQKTEQTYDNAQYDYPYTRQNFPFFYDKQHWTRYLDQLVENRMNTFYLWNGHPFTSLLRLPKYPEAQEVSDEQLAENIAMFNWLTTEADRRGIWVIQFFYNIHVSHALAKHHNIPFQLSRPNRLVSDYTRYCTGEFIANYPNVGLMMCLGEALGDTHDADWLCKVIIPGVKDGMKRLGAEQEPPIVVRAHSTPIEQVMQAARNTYSNMYTMHKWTGEGISWHTVRGETRRLHASLAQLGKGHIINVHLLANLEPFRWGSPRYVQSILQSARDVNASGLHLYPLRYWEWPVTADNVQPPLAQIDRDWIWYAAWARYAWDPYRDPKSERVYWTARLAEVYGTAQAGEKILDAYQAVGPIQPMLIRRFGITTGGRQCLSLGMLMTQLVNPDRYHPWRLMYLAEAPEGERLEAYAARQWKGMDHHGETPPRVAAAVERFAAEAVAALEAARPHVTANRDEFERLAVDARCIRALSRYYASKTRAAALVLHYGHSDKLADLEKALPLLEQSVAHYRELVRLTEKTYREACSLHTGSRRIPFVWSKAKPYRHFRDTLPEYEKELANFRRHLAALQTRAAKAAGTQAKKAEPIVPLPVVVPRVLSEGAEVFDVAPGAKVFTDRDYRIRQIAPELRGMKGIRVSHTKAKAEGVAIEFEVPEDAQILVGFLPDGPAHAKPPQWEWEPVLLRAAMIDRFPVATVRSHLFPAGKGSIDFGRGSYFVLGFTKGLEKLEPREVFAADGPAKGGGIDWLFE